MPTMNLAAPGTKYGPCKTDCNHPRCLRSRRTAEKTCWRCDRPIGYGVDYSEHPDHKDMLVHLVCPAAAPLVWCPLCERHVTLLDGDCCPICKLVL